MELFVSALGRDSWPGSLPEPNAAGTDGPLASLPGVLARLRQLKAEARLSEPVTVWLRDGRYPLSEPLVITPADTCPVTFAAYPGESPVLCGSRRITGWRTDSLNGRPAWVVDLPDVADGQWYFRSLFANGQRRARTRFPKDGFFRVEAAPGTSPQAGLFDGNDHFVAAPGDLDYWHNLGDVTVVLLHYWIEEHLPIASFDPTSRQVDFPIRTTFSLRDDFTDRWARYYVENVLEATTEPGEWYLDRYTGQLWYLPEPGQTPENTDIDVPVTTQLLRFEGSPDTGHLVEWFRFEGLTFEHTDWDQPWDEPDVRHGGLNANSYQGAFKAPGAIFLEGCAHVSFEGCTIRHTGGYAVDISDGCRGIRVVGCELTDLGAGGVKLSGATWREPHARRTGQCRITDNRIIGAGRVFHSACGILCRHAAQNVLSHNEIADLYYTGISVGWEWGYMENVARDNLIEKNHIHDLGQGLLSDMGGIYTLGVQPGTVLRGNLIHDVRRHNYGGWAIYPDEGSSHLIIENNVCYNTDSQVFHQHYGRENTVRNNIFAFGAEAVVAHSRPTPDGMALTFERNLFLSAGTPMVSTGYDPQAQGRNHRAELNLYWDLSGEPQFAPKGGRLDFASWQALGLDRHSLVADPKLADPRGGDFTPAADSPLWSLGFEPIDLSDVGPRPKDSRE